MLFGIFMSYGRDHVTEAAYKVIGTHSKRLDRGRNIFTLHDDMILLADADMFLCGLFPDIFRWTPANVGNPCIRSDAISASML